MFINLKQIVITILAILIFNAGLGPNVSVRCTLRLKVPESQTDIDASNFVISRPIEDVTIIAKKKKPETGNLYSASSWQKIFLSNRKRHHQLA